MTANYQQVTTNGHPFTSNQNADVPFLLPVPGSYTDHPDFEKDRESVRGNWLLFSHYLFEARAIRSACFGELSS